LAGTFSISKAQEPQSAVCMTDAEPSTDAPGVTIMTEHAKVADDMASIKMDEARAMVRDRAMNLGLRA